MPTVDLTHFGFTPTESLVYQALVTNGPGTGYALARAAGLARANAYSALEGLVKKGAARVDAGRPKQYRPEPPAGLIARITNDHGHALEKLSTDLRSILVPGTPTVVELGSGRAVLQLLTDNLARTTESVRLLAPPDAFPLLAPALRRPHSAGLSVELFSTSAVDLGFISVEAIPSGHHWPGMPIVAIVDNASAVIAARQGNDVQGHWSAAPSFVAAARMTLERFRTPP
jgi:HTH-type transcriptional regulator, sugar sensing transcriptional regulator